MKLTKKFFDDLDKIGQDAFIEKNMWIGKLVPEIIVDNLKKRGITPDDFEGCVVLTVNQAKELSTKLKNNADFFFLQTGEFDYDTDELWQCLTEKIEQAEMSKQSTQCENVSKKDEKIITLTIEEAKFINDALMKPTYSPEWQESRKILIERIKQGEKE